MKKLILCFLLILLCSCSSYKLATLNNDPLYPIDYVIPVTNDTKIDTINSFSDLKWKLRTDFNFRWDFAQYAMQQPYSLIFFNSALISSFVNSGLFSLINLKVSLTDSYPEP